MSHSRPKRIWGDWWLCKDNGYPKSQTPQAQEEIVRLRLENEELKRQLRDQRFFDRLGHP